MITSEPDGLRTELNRARGRGHRRSRSHRRPFAGRAFGGAVPNRPRTGRWRTGPPTARPRCRRCRGPRSRPPGRRRPLRSMKRIELDDRWRAAMAPITAAAHGCTNAHGAVIATRPANMPLPLCRGRASRAAASRLEHRDRGTNAAAKAVSIADYGEGERRLRRSVDPTFEPEPPTSRMNVPSSAIGIAVRPNVRRLALRRPLLARDVARRRARAASRRCRPWHGRRRIRRKST